MEGWGTPILGLTTTPQDPVRRTRRLRRPEDRLRSRAPYTLTTGTKVTAVLVRHRRHPTSTKAEASPSTAYKPGDKLPLVTRSRAKGPNWWVCATNSRDPPSADKTETEYRGGIPRHLGRLRNHRGRYGYRPYRADVRCRRRPWRPSAGIPSAVHGRQGGQPADGRPPRASSSHGRLDNASSRRRTGRIRKIRPRVGANATIRSLRRRQTTEAAHATRRLTSTSA